jgi:putative colanic acid biosynthesis acetyltransferase WcaF
MSVDLSKYDNNWYKPGSAFKRLAWHYTNEIFFKSGIFPFYCIKVFLLKLFGAKIGRGVLIKPCVNIKYPWFLEVGNHTWIGEDVWIDNLAIVRIGSNVCLSQGAYLLTGNHDYKRVAFDLLVKPIIIEDGAWIGAKSIVCPGVICKTQAVLSAGSVLSKDMEAFGVYRGNPAAKVGERKIED